MLLHIQIKPPNAALQQLAQVAKQRSPLMAGPLQALVELADGVLLKIKVALGFSI